MSYIIETSPKFFVFGRCWYCIFRKDVIDDGYYYFKIAQNIARGMGSSFDGLTLTNGYHPLWMLINVIGFKIFADPDRAFRIILLMGVLSDVIAGILLAWLAYRLLANQVFTNLVAALWFLNYRLYFSMLNGMETAISSMFLIASLLAAHFFISKPYPKRAIYFGMLAGLSILARLDNVFFIIILLGTIYYQKRDLRSLILIGTLMAILIAPWAIWNVSTFGRLMPTSGDAITGRILFALESEYGKPVPFSVLAAEGFHVWSRTLRRSYITTGLPVAEWSIVSVIWLITSTFLIGKYWAEKRGFRFDFWRQPSWIYGGIFVLWPILFITLHAFYRLTFRPYYQFSYAFSIILIFSYFLHQLWQINKFASRLVLSLFIPLTLFSQYQYWQSEIRSQASLFNARTSAITWLNNNLHECNQVGAFNAGFLGYFYQGYLINLDGVVNNEANAANWAGQLGKYLRDKEICFLADTEVYPGELLERSEWGTQPIEEAELIIRYEYLDRNRPYFTIYRISQNDSHSLP